MTNQDDPIQTRDGHAVVVDFFRPQDADGIAALFRDVYGDAYPVNAAQRCGSTFCETVRLRTGTASTQIFCRFIY